MRPVIIVGSGMAGYSLAREWRKLDKTSPLTIVTSDAGESYSKPMLSNAFAQGKSPEQLVSTTSAQLASQLSGSIFPLTRLLAIHPGHNTIETSRGKLEYRQLVLALGAQQRQLALSGNGATEVLTVNNLSDYRKFRDRLSLGAQRVAIIGAGLIGCEFANDLLAGGHTVNIIARSKTALDSLVPQELGAALRDALIQAGVHWYGETTTQLMARHNNTFLLHLDNGQQLQADVVLSATGLIPNVDIAKAASLTTLRGIAVNPYLQTSNDSIFALGDCAEVGTTLLPYVAPLMNQARALAKSLTGELTPVTYPVMPVVVKTPVFPIAVVPPPAHHTGTWRLEPTTNGGLKACCYANDQSLLGFALGGAATSEKTALAKLVPAPKLN